MKKLNLIFLLTALLSMVGARALAHDIEVANADGVTIYYSWKNNKTELNVSYRGSSYSSYSGEYSGNVVIPESVTYNGATFPVTSIGERAFYGCSGLTSITIPNSVTSIGGDAFSGCSGLTSVTIPNSVTSIGSSAFSGCSGLTIVKVPVTDYSAFCNNKLGGLILRSIEKPIMLIDDKGGEIKNFVIPDGVTSIGDGAFLNCSGLTSVTIPNSVTSIGIFAFRGCSGLTSVTIPNSVTSIGNYAFENCSGLKEVNFNATNCTSMGDVIFPVFRACTSLTTINIGDNVQQIPDYAFSSCSGLTSVTIGNSVTRIGNSAFRGCSGLTSVTIPNSVTSIGNEAFKNCSGLTSVTIGNSVTSIGSTAFDGCKGLTSITIPNSVTSIGGSAFSGCSSLKTIILPISLQKIAGGAFSGLKSLKDFYCYARVAPQLGDNIFENSLIGYATLHVPEKSLETYETTSPWSAFMKIVPLTDSDPDPSGSAFPGGGEGAEQCAKPTISYHKGKLNFYSATEGALCHYTISDSDITSSYGNEVQLTVTYSIMVFATKSGYRNSDAATATLCWIDVEPKTEGITNDIANIPANAVLIQSENGRISVSGAGDGTAISVFGTNGVKVGAAVSHSGQAVVDTNLSSGSVTIVKIGEKSVKVAVK